MQGLYLIIGKIMLSPWWDFAEDDAYTELSLDQSGRERKISIALVNDYANAFCMDLEFKYSKYFDRRC